MAPRPVFVQLLDGQAIRIFKSNKAAFHSGLPLAAHHFDKNGIAQMDRASAVSQIRRSTFERDLYECQRCHQKVSWATGHLDEVIPRGKGGEVSVENTQVLCAGCHVWGKDAKHSDRRPRFGENAAQV